VAVRCDCEHGTETLLRAIRLSYKRILACEICVLLGYYAAQTGNPFPTFRGNVSVPSSRVKKSKKNADLISIAAETSNQGISASQEICLSV
jgi:hypothetical protein